jgi:hypothetical protein
MVTHMSEVIVVRRVRNRLRRYPSVIVLKTSSGIVTP